jgi:hypothetical protein
MGHLLVVVESSESVTPRQESYQRVLGSILCDLSVAIGEKNMTVTSTTPGLPATVTLFRLFLPKVLNSLVVQRW